MKYYDRNGKQIKEDCFIKINNNIYQVLESPHKNLYIAHNGNYCYLTNDIDTSNILIIK